jgi:hypothetical protein
MANIQVRLDKLYGYQNWGDAALEAVVKRAADDNFNTVSIPVFWREVEPEKNEFDWTLLDKYLGWCKKYDLNAVCGHAVGAEITHENNVSRHNADGQQETFDAHLQPYKPHRDGAPQQVSNHIIAAPNSPHPKVNINT